MSAFIGPSDIPDGSRPRTMAAVCAAPSLARPRAPRAFRKSGARVSVRAVRVTATADAAKYDTVIIGAGVSGRAAGRLLFGVMSREDYKQSIGKI